MQTGRMGSPELAALRWSVSPSSGRRSRQLRPRGGGEPAIVPVGGAIAIFDAVGVRVFEMPVTPDLVWKALADVPAAR
jgi:CO/xanthine dehydrogenase Mo-binding subunit